MLTTIKDYVTFTGPYEDDSELVHYAVGLYRAITNAIIKGVI